MSQPLVAVTMGDPAGIGPEIVARALPEPGVRTVCRAVVVGDPRIMFLAMELVKGGLIVRTTTSLQGAGSDPGTLDVVPRTTLRPLFMDPNATRTGLPGMGRKTAPTTRTGEHLSRSTRSGMRQPPMGMRRLLGTRCCIGMLMGDVHRREPGSCWRSWPRQRPWRRVLGDWASY